MVNIFHPLHVSNMYIRPVTLVTIYGLADWTSICLGVFFREEGVVLVFGDLELSFTLMAFMFAWVLKAYFYLFSFQVHSANLFLFFLIGLQHIVLSVITSGLAF